jgi:DNA-binding response OmpR family regulator
MQKIWGRRQRYRDRTVDVFVRKLREKIDRRSRMHDYIHTRHGVGYKLDVLPKSAAADR